MRLLLVTSQLLGLGMAFSACVAGATPVPVATVPSPTNVGAAPSDADRTPFELASTALAADAAIPTRHTCHGENLSPPLSWSGAPAGTQSLDLVMDDADAVKVAGHVWDHWLVFIIPATETALSEGAPMVATLADGARQGQNSSKGLGYSGPCPPKSQTHGYVFTLYAVDSLLDLQPGATKAETLGAIDGHVLAQTQLVAPYTSPQTAASAAFRWVMTRRGSDPRRYTNRSSTAKCQPGTAGSASAVSPRR